jgi:heterodisulfide reductase subunit A-like polyferredoxin
MTFIPKVGVYVCHCGINISATVESAVTRFSLTGRWWRENTYMCSDPARR